MAPFSSTEMTAALDGLSVAGSAYKDVRGRLQLWRWEECLPAAVQLSGSAAGPQRPLPQPSPCLVEPDHPSDICSRRADLRRLKSRTGRIRKKVATTSQGSFSQM